MFNQKHGSVLAPIGSEATRDTTRSRRWLAPVSASLLVLGMACHGASAADASALRSVMRINVGGGDYTDVKGQLWQADFGYNTGNAYIESAEVAGTDDDALFAGRRWDHGKAPEMKYTLPIADGEYTVRLHLAETNASVQPGRRVFDVMVQGQLAADDLDIVARAGLNTALAVDLPAVVKDGKLEIEFIHQKGNPILNAIEVLQEAVELPATGAVTVEYWDALAGNAVSDLTGAGAYPGQPSVTATLKAFEVPAARGDNYGARVRGFLQPAVSGDYTFWVASDDTSELWLSTDADPANKKRIAYAPQWTSAHQWEKNSAQRSVAIRLEAGKRYYIEALHKEGVGGDHLAVAWQGGGLSRQVIDGRYLAPWGAEEAEESAPVDPSLLRVNVGGGDYTDVKGRLWQADFGYNTGSAYVENTPVEGTDDDALFAARRWDVGTLPEMKYTLPIANGEYTVRLHLAETNASVQPGTRVFDVLVEEQLVANDLDIAARAGLNKALAVDLPAVVEDGKLEIEFIHQLGNPILNAIEVLRGSVESAPESPAPQPEPQPEPAPEPAPEPEPAPGTPGDADGDGLLDSWETTHGLNSSDASDADADSDGDGYSNLEEFDAGSDPTQKGETPVMGAVEVSWTAPSTRSDGTSLAMNEIAGYRIHYGTASGKHGTVVEVSDPYTMASSLGGLQRGATYYFVVTALDRQGIESVKSNELVKTIGK